MIFPFPDWLDNAYLQVPGNIFGRPEAGGDPFVEFLVISWLKFHIFAKWQGLTICPRVNIHHNKEMQKINFTFPL